MNSRRGFTLSELMVVLSLNGIVVGLVATLLGTIFIAERKSREAATQALVLTSLADGFQADVRAATKRTPAREQGDVLLAVENEAGKTTQYERVPAGLAKFVLRGEGAERQVLARELYRLPDAWQAAIETETIDGRSLVTLRLDQTAGVDRPRVSSLWRVAAALSRDHRYMNGEKSP